MHINWIEMWRYAQVALGIGLVIFVHESGHFVAARLCGVRVDVFSLGFGPRLFGWRRGRTLYQLALVPLGGYVKMAGEEAAGSERAPAPDELPSKTVGQRFLIYSGGVLANVAFGLVVFPVILAVGVPFPEPLIGASTPGSPAWQAGLRAGSRVLSVNGNEVFSFLNIPNEVALGSPDETVLEIVEPGAEKPHLEHLKPVYSDDLGVYTVGVTPAVDPHGEIVVEDGSKAASAGLKTGDRLLRVAGGVPGLPLEDQLAMAMQRGDPFSAQFESEGRGFEARLEAERSRAVDHVVLGIAPLLNQVIAVRESEPSRAIKLRKDDRILGVNGRPILRDFDFLRALLGNAGPCRLEIERDGSILELEGPVLSDADAVRLASDVALAQDVQSTRVFVYPGSAAEEAGLRDGDRVLKIDGKSVASYKPDVLNAVGAARGGHPLPLTLERPGSDGGSTVLDISVAPRSLRPWTYGFELQGAQYVYKAGGPTQAVRVGLASSWKFLEESWRTLEHIVKGQVSGTNIGGIITIGVVSHSWASVGWTKFFFFLCMLSMNLAFLNVLPIPVLDGGHLFFLLIEKIKGSPVSERVLSYSQMVGVVLIVSLMVYVTFNDIKRWWIGP
jgi:regulator of sigma E protease